ncbi:hypothetical protein GF362_04635 [Candidatus Dojkabacteria bacterium]|nr:hypothetical protein [Candidatus Dojkabacteria bacterium]
MQIDTIVFEIIHKAQKILLDNPFDLGHDLTHHYKVWENCLKIILNENLSKKVDKELITIAAWWHDVDRKNHKNKKLIKVLQEYGYPNSKSNEVLKVIDEIDGPASKEELSSIESKVLCDADKIEYINITRWEYIKLAFKAGKFPEKAIIHYGNELEKRIEFVFNNLVFKYSRKRFIQNLKEFIQKYKQTEDSEISKSHIDISPLQNILRSYQS